MSLLRAPKTPTFVLLIALLLLPIAGLAKDGRDFNGSYNVSNIVEQGDQLILTFQVDLFNHSDADLKHAVVTLRSFRPTPSPLAQFQAVPLWRNHGEVKLSQQVVIPRIEYERWQKGAQPALFVVYHDASGQRWERFAQLRNQPGPPR
jgi:hypothetical protein